MSFIINLAKFLCLCSFFEIIIYGSTICIKFFFSLFDLRNRRGTQVLYRSKRDYISLGILSTTLQDNTHCVFFNGTRV